MTYQNLGDIFQYSFSSRFVSFIRSFLGSLQRLQFAASMCERSIEFNTFFGFSLNKFSIALMAEGLKRSAAVE